MIDETKTEPTLRTENSRIIRAELFNSGQDSGLISRISEAKAKKAYVTLEVGCGVNPKISTEVQKGDLWIGVDPGVSDIFIGADRGLNKIDTQSTRVVVRDVVENLSVFKADTIHIIAPNPVNIVDDNLLDDLGRFLKSGTEILIVLDTRTIESQSLLGQAKEKVRQFLKTNRFTQLESALDMSRGSSYKHSEDLGEKNIVVRAIKN